MPQIEIQDLTMRYMISNQEIVAVDGATLTVGRGDFLSVVGHSGSGKTTLLSIIGGIIRQSSGRVLYQGADISTLDDDGMSRYRNSQVGFMFQFASLLPMLTVKENLLLPTVFMPEPNGSEAARKAEKLLGMVGLTDKINAYPEQLSGGQQRRVASARAFMNNPAIILADEPTGDLDEETEHQMIDFFREMNRSAGITFIMVTHNTDLAKQAPRQFLMHRGAIQELSS